MARGRYGSVYDGYALSNSSTIPLYTGSAGPEMLKVGEYLQGLYDSAQSNAIKLEGSLDQLQSLPQDRLLMEELRTQTQDKLSEFSRRRDYENLVPDVQRLGINFANRYRELTAPIQQREEYKKSLENKDLNLTSSQKAGLLAMSDSAYRPLQNIGGRYTGSGYIGERPDVNIDVNKWIDDRMKDIAIQKGGSEIVNDNGEWKIKRGTKWEKLSPGTIENVLTSAMNNSPEYQAWRNMQGRLTGFQASRLNIAALPPGPAKTAILDTVNKYGIPAAEAANLYYNRLRQKEINDDALNYARSKYAVNNQWTESGQEMGELQLHRLKKAADDEEAGNNIFTDMVTGPGIDLSTKYGSAGELDSKFKAASESIETAKRYLDGQRSRVGLALGLSGKATDKQVEDWYAVNDADELARFQGNKTALAASNSAIREMNQVRDAARDEAVKSVTGNQMTFAQLQKKATADLVKTVGDQELTIIESAGSMGNRKHKTLSKENASNYEVVGVNTIRDKNTGVEYVMPFTSKGTIGADFAKVPDWKTTYKSGMQGLRSNMVWMPLLNKTTPDGQLSKSGAYAMRAQGLISAAASSGAIKIRDNNDKELDSDDATDIRTLVSAGKYNLLGIGIDPASGERRATLSVEVDKDASDVEDRYKTVMIGMDTNYWDRMSSSIKDAVGKDIQSNDPAKRAAALKAMQFGMAMQTGSSYQAISGRLQGQTQYIKNPNGWTTHEIRRAPTGDGSQVFQVYPVNPGGGQRLEPVIFNDAMDLGAYLDVLRQQGNTLTTE